MKKWSERPYSHVISRRIRILWGVLAAMLMYMVVVTELGGGDSRMMTPLAKAFTQVVFWGGIIWVCCRIHYHKKLLRDRFRMKQEQCAELDERNRYLHNRTGGIVVDVLLIAELFVTLTAAQFDMPAFYTALSLLSVTVLAKGIAYLIHEWGWE